MNEPITYEICQENTYDCDANGDCWPASIYTVPWGHDLPERDYDDIILKCEAPDCGHPIGWVLEEYEYGENLSWRYTFTDGEKLYCEDCATYLDEHGDFANDHE